GIAAGTPLRLYFDLIGLGPLGSEVQISNVQLVSNRPPVITSGTTSGAITELATVSAATDRATGSLTFTDPDQPDTHTVSVAPEGSGTGYIGTLQALVGTDSTGGATGRVNWTYQVADTALEILSGGHSEVQTYDVTVDDGNG